MPWRPVLSLLNINVNSLDIQGNPLLNITGNGGSYISQSNSQNSQSYPAHRVPGYSAYHRSSAAPASRRVEAQMRIQRKLDEACGRPGSIYGIDNVAQVAADILTLIEVFISSIPRFKLLESLIIDIDQGSVPINFQLASD